jgi:hypothetical protein
MAYEAILSEFTTTTAGDRNGGGKSLPNNDAVHLRRLLDTRTGKPLTVFSSGYDFEPQQPGGTLTAGSPATITLAPVPQGVNAADVGHLVRISGGTGTAETVLITGGTAVAGSASGTITFTPANSHSGAWTIASATAGIQEAIVHMQNLGGGMVMIPAGTYTCDTITVSAGGVTLVGAGKYATTIAQRKADATLFSVNPGGATTIWGFELVNLTITDAVSTTSGHLIDANNVSDLGVSNSRLIDGYNAIRVQGCYIVGLWNTLVANQTGHYQLLADGVQSGPIHISHCKFGGDSPQPSNGIQLKSASGIYMDDTDLYQCGNALALVPGNGQHVGDVFIANCSFDSGSGVGVLIQPSHATGYVTRLKFANCWSATNRSGVFADLTLGTLRGFSWVGGQCINNKQGGFSFSGDVAELRITSADIGYNSADTEATYDGITIGANVGDVQILGNRIGQPMDWWNGAAFTNVQACGIQIYAGAGDYIIVQNNIIRGNTYNIANSATGAHNSVQSA